MSWLSDAEKKRAHIEEQQDQAETAQPQPNFDAALNAYEQNVWRVHNVLNDIGKMWEKVCKGTYALDSYTTCTKLVLSRGGFFMGYVEICLYNERVRLSVWEGGEYGDPRVLGTFDQVDDLKPILAEDWAHGVLGHIVTKCDEGDCS